MVLIPNFRLGKLLIFLLIVVFASMAPIAAQQTKTISGQTYLQEDEKWFMEYAGDRFEVDREIITVKFRKDVDAAAKSAFYSTQKFSEMRANKLGFVDLKVPEGMHPMEFVEMLQQQEIVEIAEVNTIGEYVAAMNPDDPQYTDQWHIPKIRATRAWEATTGSPAIIIGILDSGSDIGHEDLNGNIWINPGEDIDGDRAIVAANVDHLDNDDKNNVDDDGNGFVDDLCGWDFDVGDNNVRGPFYHGTHVAGVVGAMSNNNTGVAGVAGGWGTGAGCTMMIVGVGANAPNGGILDDAIIYAADNGARIISISLKVGSSTAIDNAINYAYNTMGCLIVCAAGNDFGTVKYPANHADVMAVSSIGKTDVISGFSNRGPEIEITAPGDTIWSTKLNNTYGWSNGTSFAAPQVSAVAGLMLSCNDTLTNAELRNLLQTSAVDLGDPGRDDLYGFGRLDAKRAVEAAGCEIENCTCRCNASGATGNTNVAWIMLTPVVVGIIWRHRIKKRQNR